MATERSDGDTRSRVLAAARAEFADKGIAGARVDAIAQRAGANKQALYYYFDSKDKLFREILRQRALESDDLLREWQWLEPGHLEFIAGQEGQSVYYPPGPETDIRLLMWEALEYREDWPIDEEDPRYAHHQGWIERIQQQQELGELAPELDPVQLLLLELALIVFPVAFPQVTRFASGMSPTDPEFIAARAQFLRDLVQRLSGSRPRSDNSRPKREAAS